MTTLLIPLQEAENPLVPHLSEVIAAIVFALLLTFLIARFVVPRFEATYAERTAAIQGGLERAEKAQEAADAALRQYNEQLAEARTEAARIREEAKSEGTQILADLREQAQAEVARIRTQGEAQLEAERTHGDDPDAELRSAPWPPRWRAGSSASRSRTISEHGVRSIASLPSSKVRASRLPQVGHDSSHRRATELARPDAGRQPGRRHLRH